LVFDIERTDIDVIIHLKVEPNSRNQSEKVPMRVTERQFDVPIPDQKLRVRLAPPGSYQDPGSGEIVFF
jgi:hypothetical protein